MKPLKIGPYHMPIRFTPNPSVGGQPVFGYYIDENHEIGLDKFLKHLPEQLRTTLLHEALEAINIVNAIDLDHKQIEQLTTTIAQLLLDNKHFRALFEQTSDKPCK